MTFAAPLPPALPYCHEAEKQGQTASPAKPLSFFLLHHLLQHVLPEVLSGGKTAESDPAGQREGFGAFVPEEGKSPCSFPGKGVFYFPHARRRRTTWCLAGFAGGFAERAILPG